MITDAEWVEFCASRAAPIGCNSPLPIIVIAAILAVIIGWVVTHENKEVE